MNWLGIDEAAMVLLERRLGQMEDEESAAVHRIARVCDSAVMLLNFYKRYEFIGSSAGNYLHVIAGVADSGVIWMPVRESSEYQTVQSDRYDSWHHVQVSTVGHVWLADEAVSGGVGFDPITGLQLVFDGGFGAYGYELALAIAAVGYDGQYASQALDDDLYASAVGFLNSY